MSLRRLTRSGPITQQRRITFALCATFLTGIVACAKLDAFGEDWFDSKEGEASVFKPDGSNGLVLVARVQAADWIKAVARQ